MLTGMWHNGGSYCRVKPVFINLQQRHQNAFILYVMSNFEKVNIHTKNGSNH